MANVKGASTKVRAGDTDSGQRHKFETGAMREQVLTTRYDLIPSRALDRLAQRFSLGASKYGDWNWQAGLPFADTFNHVIAHLNKHKDAIQAGVEPSEDDLAAAAWGIVVLMEQQATHMASERIRILTRKVRA